MFKKEKLQKQEISQETDEKTFSPTTTSNIKRSGPRSKLVEAIAILLFSRPLRSAEIAQLLGYSPRYISSYLSYWRYRGLFEYENGFWYLTPEGEEYARNIIQREMDARLQQYTTLARQILQDHPNTTSYQVKSARKDKNVLQDKLQSGQFLQFTATLTNNISNKQLDENTMLLCITSAIDESELTMDEKEVLDALISHYLKWGTTYTYLDQLEELMQADRTWLIKTLRMLQAKGFIYIYNDKRLGTRIGFSKKLRMITIGCQQLVKQ